jgi:N-dimethylarginine dimethylaminohydrolase
MPRCLMSPPGATWRIRGGTNFRSQDRPDTDPVRARAEWDRLVRAIGEAGGEVVVMPAPAVEPPLTGMIYTANAGQQFADGFLVSRMWAPHRQDEAAHVETFVRGLGQAVARAQHVWEGQAEVCPLPGGRFLLSWGIRSDRESTDEVRARLGAAAQSLDVRLREPFFHGDTCLSSLATPHGPVLLACEAALSDRSLVDLRAFAPGVELVPVSEADARAYACNALGVGRTWLVPTGVSSALLQRMESFGLRIVELDLSELFGKGGGGPRCMVNVLA